MGVYTVYDILTDNPGFVNGIDHNRKLYEWNNMVRVIFKDGTVSNIGYYNSDYGSVDIKKEKKLFNFFQKNNEYIVVDSITINFINDYDGFLIHDYVYIIFIQNKNYKK